MFVAAFIGLIIALVVIGLIAQHNYTKDFNSIRTKLLEESEHSEQNCQKIEAMREVINLQSKNIADLMDKCGDKKKICVKSDEKEAQKKSTKKVAKKTTKKKAKKSSKK